MDVLSRLKSLLQAKGWSEYKLAKQSGLSESTIANIFKRHNIPQISTLETICKTFGITLSQFFSDDNLIEITPELYSLFSKWTLLTSEQKSVLLQLMDTMNKPTEK